MIDLGITNPELLAEALTHSSYAHEHGCADNERLEFLGDSILNSCTTLLLMEAFPSAREGQLSRMRARLVRTETLADIGRSLALGLRLRLGKGEEQSGGRKRQSNLADATESVLGAYYVEHGFVACLKLVRSWMTPRMNALDTDIQSARGWKDPRSRLQEHTQQHQRITPTYSVLSTEGPPHDPVFTVQVHIGSQVLGEGRGNNKRVASRKAAEDALSRLESL